MESKKDLILLHGALGSKSQFEKNKPLLESHFNLYMPDLPGHSSLASQRGDFDIVDFSNYLYSYIYKNNIKEPNIFGFSMGGYTALYLEAAKSRVFNKIMTLGTKFDWNPVTAENESKYLIPEKIIKKVPQYADYLITLHGKNNWEELLRKQKKLMFRLGENNILNERLFARIKCPVLITRGENDKMVTREESTKVSDSIKNSTYYEFEGFDHPIEKLDRNILADRIRDFFEGESL